MFHHSDIKEIYVSLKISGFACSPDDITLKLGIQPSKIRVFGKEDYWILKSELPQSADPNEHLKNILEKVRPRKKKLVELAKQYKAMISFGIHWQHYNPAIMLEKNTLQELAELNLSVDFDMYYLENK